MAVAGSPAPVPRARPPLPGKSMLQDVEQIRLAIEMIGLGARLQVLESEVSLPRVRLIRLYKELCGVSPPKGMLPFSTDWFVTWRPNAHASMLLGAYRFMTSRGGLDGIRAVLSSYRMYREQLCATGEAAQLSFTRAWTLVRFYERGMLQLARCRDCGGEYVVQADDARHRYVCGLCLPPARAGKGRKPAPAALAG
ncbi:flagellar transcriptional regulator FlhC [Cupriavidus sp. UYPR2.512]|uniref:flagellar transcriptional regulator FlhC n=1 Tax=Cupriavidus sp. UYPR2.512 TaxID=1080187 RepID=UPI0006886B2B|nr:flagellar transcriptional regulator FlhC [Cupriavidus sp. UYPR2.512]UIF91843.1 flagellar transcriptional regulator FlhC [Cupriavidus necator]